MVTIPRSQGDLEQVELSGFVYTAIPAAYTRGHVQYAALSRACLHAKQNWRGF